MNMWSSIRGNFRHYKSTVVYCMAFDCWNDSRKINFQLWATIPPQRSFFAQDMHAKKFETGSYGALRFFTYFLLQVLLCTEEARTDETSTFFIKGHVRSSLYTLFHPHLYTYIYTYTYIHTYVHKWHHRWKSNYLNTTIYVCIYCCWHCWHGVRTSLYCNG